MSKRKIEQIQVELFNVEQNSLETTLKKPKLVYELAEHFSDELINESFSPEHSSTEELFNSLKSAPLFMGNGEGRNNKIKGKFTIYTVNSLPELIQGARSENFKEQVTLRFIMTPEKELLFAREGLPNSYIPPHFAMTGQSQNQSKAITAGNIKINRDNEISFVSNKSGNFRPSWDSVQYALAALLASGVKFADEIEMEKDVIESFRVKLDSLVKEIDSKFSEDAKNEFQEINSNLTNRTHIYPLKPSHNNKIGLFGNSSNHMASPLADRTNRSPKKLSYNNEPDFFSNGISSPVANRINRPFKKPNYDYELGFFGNSSNRISSPVEERTNQSSSGSGLSRMKLNFDNV